MPGPPKHVTIIGGGLTGLTTAFLLSRQLPRTSKIVIVEKQDRIGGWLGSTRHTLPDGHGEVVLESGARSIRPRGGPGAVRMLKLIQQLDMLDSILPIPFSHPAAKNRFVLNPRTNDLTLMPTGPLSIFKQHAADHLLHGLLMSVLREPFKSKQVGVEDESIDSLVRRRLGPGVAENMVSAMVHGIYAADSRMLSARSSFPVLWDAEQTRGSIVLGMLRGAKLSEEAQAKKNREKAEWDEVRADVRGAKDGWSLYGLRGGIGALEKQLERHLRSAGVEFRLGEGVEKLEQDQRGLAKVYTSKPESEPLQNTHVVSTIAPSLLASLLQTSAASSTSAASDRASRLLRHNPSTTVGVVNMVFPVPSSLLHPEGFGYLVPRADPALNPEGVIGVVFDSLAIPELDEPSRLKKMTKLTLMIGGPHWSTYPRSMTDASPKQEPSDPDDLILPALAHLHRVFPHLARLPPPTLVVPHIHKECIPTYLVGHGQRLKQLHVELDQAGWKGRLSVAGSGYGGVGVNDCVFAAQEVADGLLRGEAVTGLERWTNWV